VTRLEKRRNVCKFKGEKPLERPRRRREIVIVILCNQN
jgi:hypothetical protein